MAGICWDEFQGAQLHQGDFLPGIQVPLFQTPFQEPSIGAEYAAQTEVQVRDVIVVNQTCDLEHNKLRFVALCPAQTIAEMEAEQSGLSKSWKEVLKGRREGLHLLSPCENQLDHRTALVVDFREIISLPRGYVERHAFEIGKRQRLLSPYLEHFSQAFGRFYMRVALPADVVTIP